MPIVIRTERDPLEELIAGGVAKGYTEEKARQRKEAEEVAGVEALLRGMPEARERYKRVAPAEAATIRGLLTKEAEARAKAEEAARVRREDWASAGLSIAEAADMTAQDPLTRPEHKRALELLSRTARSGKVDPTDLRTSYTEIVKRIMTPGVTEIPPERAGYRRTYGVSATGQPTWHDVAMSPYDAALDRYQKAQAAGVQPDPRDIDLLNRARLPQALQPGAAIVERFPTAPTAGVSGPQPAGDPRLMMERPMAPGMATQFIHRQTLTPPPPGTTLSETERSNYVQVPAAALPTIRPTQTIRTLMRTIEEIAARRDDLFPRATGDFAKDSYNIAKSKAIWHGLRIRGGDPDVRRLLTIEATLPTVARQFGDTGNIAVMERLMTARAIGVTADTREATLAAIDQLRQFVDANLSTLGIPPEGRPERPAAAPTGRVRVRKNPRTGRLEEVR